MLNFFIDTHCHLDFFDNLEEIISNAQKANVTSIVAPSVHSQSADKLLQDLKPHQSTYIALGIHPVNCYTEGNWESYPDQDVAKLDTLLKERLNNKDLQEKIVAIGECGLDFKFGTNDTNVETQDFASLQQIQIQLFKQHLIWASTYNIPLIIHNRKANNELLSLLKEFSNTPSHPKPKTLNLKLDPDKLTGVFHCFAGSKKLAQEVLETGFYIGVGGLLTADTGLQEVIKSVPLEKIILETDAPYLTPKQLKETKPWPNEPANVIYAAQCLADIKQTTLEKVAELTTQNAKQLFKV